MNRAALPLAALLISLAGCAASPPLQQGLPAGMPATLELADTPFFSQLDYQCGPAALATILQASGIPVEPAALAPQVYLPGRQGSLQAELVGATRRHGRLAYPLPGTGQALLAELSEGRPVLLLLNLGPGAVPVWHYAVLVGYDAPRNVALLRSGTTRRLVLRWQEFARAWDRGGRWAVTALTPGIIPVAAEPMRYLEAAAGMEAAGKQGAAATAYAAATSRWPGQPLAWLGLGNVAHAAGEFPAAAAAYAAAARLAPDNAAIRNNLGQALADAGCYQEARRQLVAAARLAAGSGLAQAIEETRSAVDAVPRAAEIHCPAPAGGWPD